MLAGGKGVVHGVDLKFDTVMVDLDSLTRSAEYKYIWWFSVAVVVIFNQADRIDEV